jgi:hypothetical protein
MTFEEWMNANGSICPIEWRYGELVWNAALDEAARTCEKISASHLNSGRYVSVVADHSVRAGGQADGAGQCFWAITDLKSKLGACK